ncbi:MAG: hypothetical protein JSW68_00080 [Burkholderiales bacterium]|nr:MAG: hypothetical protein JSW68_00080 [Burkholderiales bacterium]
MIMRSIGGPPGLRGHMVLPSRLQAWTPALVTVHGISRNAGSHARAFASAAATEGWLIVAPQFDARGFRGYQRLAGSGPGPGRVRADLALDALLERVADATGVDTRRFMLFGFSGGAQFAHRYAMLQPGRVSALVLGAAGWYTFPCQRLRFPHGLRCPPGGGACIEPGPALSIPTLVMVGTRDLQRDAALNCSPCIDARQGRNRLERARRWVDAMRRAAQERGIGAHFELRLMADCGHSFECCVERGDMHRASVAFLAARAGCRADVADPLAARAGCRTDVADPLAA